MLVFNLYSKSTETWTDILSDYRQAAEAYMSLGNVSYARTNEAYFRQALRYLRSTGRVPGYDLPLHLQR